MNVLRLRCELAGLSLDYRRQETCAAYADRYLVAKAERNLLNKNFRVEFKYMFDDKIVHLWHNVVFSHSM
jgi:hypothetical protein